MLKIKNIFLLAFVSYFLYGLFISQYDISIFPESLERRSPTGYYDYSGVINVHTDKSTGSGHLDKVIKAAQLTNLDFIFVTDINDFSPNKIRERYYDRLMVFVDGEYSYLDSRLVLLGRSSYEKIDSFGQSQMILSDLISKSEKEANEGITLLAHPYKRGYQWNGPVPSGIDGLEVINLKSLWQNSWINDKVSFLWSLFIYPFNPELALLRMFPFPDKELELWDQLNKERRVLGVAGSDAEAKLKLPRDSSLNVPSYETIFNIVRNHVILSTELTGQFESDREKLLDAIRNGHFYLSLDKLAKPNGFNALVHKKSGKKFRMGSKLPFEENLKLKISLPQKPFFPFDVMIFKDGEKILSANSEETSFILPEPGTYRVVVRVIPTFPLPDGKKWVPWIFTNPFYIH